MIRFVIIFTLFFALYTQKKVDRNIEELMKMDLEELLNVKISVASKFNEEQVLSPSNVTVFTKKEIERMGLRSLDELINFVPGFQSQKQVSYGNSSTIQVRGKPENGYLSKDVLVLKDGVRLNDYLTGGSSFITRSINIQNLEKIEIIRGPGSALYGSNAFLGVINLFGFCTLLMFGHPCTNLQKSIQMYLSTFLSRSLCLRAISPNSLLKTTKE